MLSTFFGQSYDYTYPATDVDTGGFFLFTGIYLLFFLVYFVLVVVAMWKVFEKAGQPGWSAIVPIYNIWVLLKIVGRPGWWLLLFFVPFVGLVVSLLVALDLAKSFKKSELFGVIALWFFSAIGYLILGFGKDTYHGPSVVNQSSSNTVMNYDWLLQGSSKYLVLPNGIFYENSVQSN